MNKYAKIVNNKVTFVVESETQPNIPGETWVELAVGYGPGDTYIGSGVFEKSSVELPSNITVLAFLSRFTDAEAIAIDLASIGATVEAATLRRYMQKVSAAKFIDLNRADTRAGVQALELMGILAAGRAAQILDTPIAEIEGA